MPDGKPSRFPARPLSSASRYFAAWGTAGRDRGRDLPVRTVIAAAAVLSGLVLAACSGSPALHPAHHEHPAVTAAPATPAPPAVQFSASRACQRYLAAQAAAAHRGSGLVTSTMRHRLASYGQGLSRLGERLADDQPDPDPTLAHDLEKAGKVTVAMAGIATPAQASRINRAEKHWIVAVAKDCTQPLAVGAG